MKQNIDRSVLKEIAVLFFKLGSISFGGPAAHIAMMEKEVVDKRKWMTSDHFLDLIGATNIIPGPNSTEMVMHCGYEKGGLKGMIVAGVSFIFPAIFITAVLAYLYNQYGELPQVQPFIYGIQPAVIAIIVGAVIKLGKKAIKSKLLAVLGVLVLVFCLLGFSQILALFSCGFIAVLIHLISSKSNLYSFVFPFSANIVIHQVSNFEIFWIFFKVGAILYGSGYVLFAFLEEALVDTGLMSIQVLIDSVAMGQFTPGPVLSTATFIGWQLNGFWGALLASLGIFSPSFIFVAILNPLMPKIKKSIILTTFLNAVSVAAVAVILAVAITMTKVVVSEWKTLIISLLSALIVFKYSKINSAWIVLGGSGLGYLFSLI